MYNLEITRFQTNRSFENVREFQDIQVRAMTLKDQYMFGTVRNQITVWDLQSNKIIHTLPDNEGVKNSLVLFIVDNKIICVEYDCKMSIWKLNGLQLFKKFKRSYDDPIIRLSTSCSIDADSKKMAFYGDLVVYVIFKTFIIYKNKHN